MRRLEALDAGDAAVLVYHSMHQVCLLIFSTVHRLGVRARIDLEDIDTL